MPGDDLMQKLRALPDGKRVGDQPTNEADHFIRCDSCGGWIDCRRLDQVFAHEEPGHTAETVQ